MPEAEIASPIESAASAGRLLVLTLGDVTRDPRARRASQTALGYGLEVDAVCLSIGGGTPVDIPGLTITQIGTERVSDRLRQAGLGGERPDPGFVRELRGVFRVARMVIRTLRLVRGARHSPAPSVIHANDFDTLPAGWLIRRRTGARLVYDSHEIYSSLEPNPPRVSQWLALQVERALARRADAVVTTGDEYADALVRILRLESRPLIARNCPERSEERPFSSGTGALRVIYQAAMSPGRRIEDILVAAENAPGVEITLRVVGADYPGLAREIARRGIEERLKLAPPVPADKLVDALDGFDVGLIINRPVTLTDELVCPNKLFEYMMAGLAVAAPRLPELARIIDGEEVGVTFPPGEPEELGRALASLAERREDVLELRRRARSVALLRYTAEAQVPALLQAWAVVPRSVAPTSA